MFRRKRVVEFVGGPYDGYRQETRLDNSDGRDLFAIPVSANVFRLLDGDRQGPKTPASSIAVYELRKRKGGGYYHFTGAKMPEEFGVNNQQI